MPAKQVQFHIHFVPLGPPAKVVCVKKQRAAAIAEPSNLESGFAGCWWLLAIAEDT